MKIATNRHTRTLARTTVLHSICTPEHWCHGAQKTVSSGQLVTITRRTRDRALVRARINGQEWHGWTDKADLSR